MNSSATRSVGYLDWEFREIVHKVLKKVDVVKKKLLP